MTIGCAGLIGVPDGFEDNLRASFPMLAPIVSIGDVQLYPVCGKEPHQRRAHSLDFPLTELWSLRRAASPCR